jgi:methionine-gamma-lyase
MHLHSKDDAMQDRHAQHPESLMMSLGHQPSAHSDAVKMPLYASSTYVFPDARTGAERFRAVHGDEDAKGGGIYARLSHPNLQLVEERLRVWEEAESALLFHSGMSAIATTFLAHLRPGDALLFSAPVYGGTDHLIRETLPSFGIQVLEFDPSESDVRILQRVRREGLADRVAMLYTETPANPTNRLMDLGRCRRLADRFSKADRQTLLVVDNTYLGPIWQRPLDHGADLVLYSATKYLAGHSDVVAGAALGCESAIAPIRGMRVYMGTAAGPWTAWLLTRSLETLRLRMERQTETAQTIAHWLRDLAQTPDSPIQHVRYLGFLAAEDPAASADPDQARIYAEQCLGPGAMIVFAVGEDREDAFDFLDGLKLVRLAVSLGGTESLAEHPASMTHGGMDPELRAKEGIHENLVRLSVGVEHPEDLKTDLKRAFEHLAQCRAERLVQVGR